MTYSRKLDYTSWTIYVWSNK